MITRTANGFYLPSYFYITIESDENIDVCIENNEQTFIHEYIHFLQDLILPYCIRQTLISNRDFTLIVSTAYKDKLMARPFKKWDEDSEITYKQLDYTWGGNDFIENKHKIKNIKSEYFEIDTNAKVYKYILTLNDGSKYQVGARDFLEYIAHKIESKNWKVNHPAFPYKTVDLIFEYYGFDWITDEVKICIIEFTLYNDNPMNLLVSVLIDSIKATPKHFNSYETCKNLLLRTMWNSTGGFSETMFTKTERRLKDLQVSLNGKYANENFIQIQKWIGLIINFSKKELSNKFIFTELFMLDKNEFNKKISFFLEQIGIPMVFNNKDECISLLPEDFNQNDFVPLYVVNKFMSFSSSNESVCPLKQFCTASMNEIIDDNCTNNLKMRAKTEELCNFGAFIKSYGLHDIQWKTT